MWILKLREVHVTLLSVRNIDLHVMKWIMESVLWSLLFILRSGFLILEVFVYCCWLFCPFVFMSAAFFFESAICNTCLFREYLTNIYKNKSAYLCVNIYLLSMIPKNCLSFMYKNKEGQKQYLFYLVIINFDFHIWEFLLSSLLSGLIFIVNKFDNKYWKARIYFTISSHCEKKSPKFALWTKDDDSFIVMTLWATEKKCF